MGTELARRSRMQAAANEQEVLDAIILAGKSGIRPGRELADQAGLPERTVRAALARLESQGLVRRDGKRRVWLRAPDPRTARDDCTDPRGTAVSERLPTPTPPLIVPELRTRPLSAPSTKQQIDPATLPLRPRAPRAEPDLTHMPADARHCPSCNIVYHPNPYYRMPTECDHCSRRLRGEPIS